MIYIAWMGQELLTTFENEIGELALIPGDAAVFKVTANGGMYNCHYFHYFLFTYKKKVVVWDRKEEKGFPELKELVNHKA